jgi:hypothetical protein
MIHVSLFWGGFVLGFYSLTVLCKLFSFTITFLFLSPRFISLSLVSVSFPRLKSLTFDPIQNHVSAT